jgi:tetratricopeptide (TPR) repeat protein
MNMNNQRKLTRKEKIELSRQAPSAPSNHKKKSASNYKKPSSDPTLKLVLGLIAAALGFFLYIGTLNYEYTLDDFSTIKQNTVVQKGVSGIGTLLSTSYRYGYWSSNDELYRPLSLIMFAIEWQLFPDSPSIGHIISILLYALTGIVLFNLLLRLFKNNMAVSFITTLLFMAHPAHTEVVANIKSRDEILSFLLSIGSIHWLLDYLETKKITKLFLSGALFFLALMAKESALTLLAIVPVLLYVFKDVPWKKGITLITPLALASFVYIMIRASVLHGVIDTKKVALLDNVLASAPDFITRFSTAMYVLGRYLLLLVFPDHFSMDYSYSEITLMKISDYKFIISFVIYLGLLIYAINKISKKDIIAFSILYYLISMSIVSNIFVVIGTVMADRLVYAPSLAICIVLAVLVTRIFKGGGETSAVTNLNAFFRQHLKPFMIAAAVLLLYSFKTLSREKVWENDMELYKSGVEDSPNSSRCQYLLGIEIRNKTLKEEKDSTKRVVLYAQIEQQFKKAVELCPVNFDAYRDLGRNYMEQGDTMKALENYDLALKYNPYESLTLNNKAVIYFQAGRYGEAMEMFKTAVRSNPKYADGLKNLGSCYGVFKDYDNAILYFNKSLEYETDDEKKPETYRMMGMTYQYMGNQPMADIFLEKSRKQIESNKLKNLE